jgi:hypothetical protein
MMGALVACLVLAGCLPFPLGNPEKSAVDAKLAGYWYVQEEDQQTLITLYPYDAHTYVMSAAEFRKDGDKVEMKELTLYKAWLTQVKGAQFITLDALSQKLPAAADEKPIYLVARLVSDATGITVKPIDGDFEPIKSVKSAEELTKVITANLDEPKLYASNPTHYRRLDAEKDADTLKPLLERLK